MAVLRIILASVSAGAAIAVTLAHIGVWLVVFGAASSHPVIFREILDGSLDLQSLAWLVFWNGVLIAAALALWCGPKRR